MLCGFAAKMLLISGVVFVLLTLSFVSWTKLSFVKLELILSYVLSYAMAVR